jgi:NAD(P)H-dependent FMN reductase
VTKVLALAGSLRSNSYTRLALQEAAAGARAAGATVTVHDLGAPPLPLFEEAGGGQHPAVARFKELALEADAVLIATPVYHDSYSGVLKNALDFLYQELADKVVGLISVGGGRAGQGQALEHLRAVLREMSCWPLNQQVLVSAAADAFDEHGVLKDPEVTARLRELGEETVRRAEQLAKLPPNEPQA